MSKFVVDGSITRRSQVIQTDKTKDMISAMRNIIDPSVTPLGGQFGQRAIITIERSDKKGNYVFDNADYEFEFDVPFGYALEAKKAEIIIYNIPKSGVTISAGKSIEISAGYGDNINRIFLGTIKNAKTKRDDLDRITTIKAETNAIVNDVNMNQTYINKAKASYILKDLLKVTKKPIYYFSTTRDYTYADSETIDGSLISNIDRIAGICGAIVTYGSGIIVCPYTYFRKNNPQGTVSYLNGLLDYDEWSEEEKNGTFVDVMSGYNVTMLLNPQIHALSVFRVNTAETEKLIVYNDQKGYGTKLIALSGSHEYDGDKMITKVKGVV